MPFWLRKLFIGMLYFQIAGENLYLEASLVIQISEALKQPLEGKYLKTNPSIFNTFLEQIT